MLSFTCGFLSLLPSAAQGDREWRQWSDHHLRTPHILSLFQHGVPLRGDSPPRILPVWAQTFGNNCTNKPAPAWAPLSIMLRSCQQSAPAHFPQAHSLLWASSCMAWGSPQAAGTTAASPWSASQAAGESQCLEQLLPLPLHSPAELLLSLAAMAAVQ